jgi:hypothetical protein
MVAPAKARAQAELKSLQAAVGHTARAVKAIKRARQQNGVARRSATLGIEAYAIAEALLGTAESIITSATAKLNVKLTARRRALRLGFER